MDPDERARFEQVVLPHLDGAFNLARWLLRNRGDAEDVAQEALLRAYRFFGGYHGGDARAWLLQIVRNTCHTFLEKNRPAELMTEFDETHYPQTGGSPEAQAIAGDDRERRERWKNCHRVFARCWCCANWKAARTKKSPRLLRCPLAR